jgi:hypothetical protein
MKRIPIFLAAGAVLFAAGPKKTFTGVITDTMCGADHTMMNVKPDSKCVIDCVKMGNQWKYALLEGKNVYVLSDQKTPEKYAAQKVMVTGTLDEKAKTIQVESIKPAK